MRWERDPDFALQTRLSVGRRAAVVALLAIGGLFLALLAAGAPRTVFRVVGIISFCSLLIAAVALWMIRARRSAGA